MVAVPVVAPVVPVVTPVVNATNCIWPLLAAEFVGTKNRLYALAGVSPVIFAVAATFAVKAKAVPAFTAV